jgi:hypothetical protein
MAESKAAAAAQSNPVVPAGRGQEGEVQEGVTLSTKAPRGVGEPAADARAGAKGVAALQGHVRGVVEDETAKGYRGVKVDPTPNENYTVKGVTSGKPTPETVVHTPRGQR